MSPSAQTQERSAGREIVLSNARIVLGDGVLEGSVALRDGHIADIAAGPLSRGEDLGGDFLLPGLVELHTDHLETHFTPRPGVAWDAVPAVLAHDVQLSGAGVTTVLDAVRIGFMGHVDDEARSAHRMVDAITHVRAAQLTRAEHFVHLRCEVAAARVTDQFAALADVPVVALVSLMDHTPGQRQYADVEAFRRYMVGKGVITEAELEPRMAALREEAAEFADVNRAGVAAMALQRGLTLAAHDDASAEHVRESADLGVHISEFPTTEVAATAAREHGQVVVMGAPNLVRGASQSGNVAAARLLELGLLDILSSDYVPASPLQAIFQLAAEERLSIEDGVRLVATNPAAAVGLSDRGEISPGRRADLVRVHPHDADATADRPRGQRIPVVRGLYRAGVRVL